MSEAQLESYEEIPYDSRPFAATHPDTLATVATLFGMRPAPPGRCRVLELGCAGGGNLLPMALALPDSTFVGIDLSPSHIADAQGLAAVLGLGNANLRAASILDVDASFGLFDYIICHGVYSWVPPPVQDKILTICKENLAPQGVAYVSYNTFPGWHLKGVLRGMLRFHAAHFADAATRVRQARALMDLLARAAKAAGSVYAHLLEEEIAVLQPETDTYLFHEYLEEVNAPLYLYEFAERAAAHGLQYLEEAEPSPLPSGLPPEVMRVLNQLPVGLIHREQYLDFIRGRGFRRTLLCHDDVTLRRPPPADVMTRLHLTAIARPVSPDVDPTSSVVEEFRGAKGRTASTNDPLVKAALLCLSRAWPRSLPFHDLWAHVEATLARGDEAWARLAQSPGLLEELVLQCWMGGLIEAHVHVVPFVLEVSERPLASPLARLQADGDGLLTNLRHLSVRLDDFDRLVLHQLDGNRDRDAILDALAALVDEGVLTLEQDGRALPGAEARPLLEQALTPALQRLAQSALLIG